METDHTAGLNPEQARAVATNERNVVVIAGAGSGKTRVLTRRVQRLLATGVPGYRILCLTFTRDAAQEMVARLGNLKWPPVVKTIHGWAFGIIRQRPELVNRNAGFTVYDAFEQEAVLRECASHLGLDNALKARPETLRKDERVLRLYGERLKDANAIDFDALIEGATEVVSSAYGQVHIVGGYTHLLIDEYQDTDPGQAKLLDMLQARWTFIVGDPRQSIYRFRGAAPELLLARSHAPDVELIELPRNYRSLPPIVAFANDCVDGSWEPMVADRSNDGPAARVFVVENEPEAVARFVADELTRGRPPTDIAVIGRHWSTLLDAYRVVSACGIPSTYYGSTDDPWSTYHARGLLRLLLLARNPADDNLAAALAEFGLRSHKRIHSIARARVFALRNRHSLLAEFSLCDEQWKATYGVVGAVAAGEQPTVRPREIGQQLLHALGVEVSAELRARLDEIAAFDSLDDVQEWWIERGIQERTRSEAAGVHFLTVHAAKGLEWPVVVMLDCRAGVYPTARSTATEEDQAEDLRAFYVGVTRARDRLVLCVPTHYRESWGRRDQKPAKPSPFLQAAHAPLPERL